MGLDMYLNGKRYLSSFQESDVQTSEAIQKMFPDLKDFRGDRGGPVVKQIEIEVGYWRKANAIHNWFVKNVQEGEDDCKSYYVSRGNLKELRDLCQRVLDFKHLANEQLPTQGGFFFGSTDYDEGYFGDVEDTIRIVDLALALPDSWDLEYQSSW